MPSTIDSKEADSPNNDEAKKIIAEIQKRPELNDEIKELHTLAKMKTSNLQTQILSLEKFALKSEFPSTYQDALIQALVRSSPADESLKVLRTKMKDPHWKSAQFFLLKGRLQLGEKEAVNDFQNALKKMDAVQFQDHLSLLYSEINGQLLASSLSKFFEDSRRGPQIGIQAHIYTESGHGAGPSNYVSLGDLAVYTAVHLLETAGQKPPVTAANGLRVFSKDEKAQMKAYLNALP